MNNAVLESKNITLLETLDRVMNKGVILSGDITISVADVDLIFVGLKVLLASVETAGKMQRGYCAPNPQTLESLNPRIFKPSNPKITDERRYIDRRGELEEIKAVLPRIDANPEKVEQGLAKLVLTLIDLIRRLMEKQAIRRMDGGSLSDEEVERLGDTFMRLEDKMEELKRVFGLKDEDLNLNLGPLGDLM